MTKLIDGKPRTLDDIIQEYAGLVRHIAIRYEGDYEADDLASEGMIGLMHAYDRYDDSKGVPFDAFSRTIVIGRMLRLNRKPSTGVHYPKDVVEIAWSIRKHELTDSAVEDIATTLHKPATHVERALHYLHYRGTIRMDAVIGEDDATQHDLNGTSDDHTELMVSDFISTLTETERLIVDELYKGTYQSVIGKQLGMAQYQVSRALNVIRDKYENYNREGVQ